MRLKHNDRMSVIDKKILLANGRTKPWSKTIKGEPASKANSRKIAEIKGVSRIIKSAKALAYSKLFLAQCPILDPMFEGDVCVEIEILYASRRPDLDESLILDLLQSRIYRNDRQVRKKIIYGGIDREDPRINVTVSTMACGTGAGGT